ncbi:MAG: hypothetical protein HOV79_03355 [Hamadaea sp.]|nr:hypothetical protein [Hamadaea sp.]
MTDLPGEAAKLPPDSVPVSFLRLDRPELDSARRLIVRGAVEPRLRESRRLSPHAPLAYLYERPDPDAPDHDLALSMGHFDEAGSVWVFSGEVDGVIGLTQPMSSAGDPPAGRRGEETR